MVGESRSPNKKSKKKSSNSTKKKKSQDTFSNSFRFGVSKIDMDIKAFISTITDEKTISSLLKDVLRSFVLNIPYKWDMNAVDPNYRRDVRIIKVTISKLNDDLLYNWYTEYMSKTLNISGVLKNILHYQLYKDVSLIKIDLSKYIAQQEQTVGIVTNNIQENASAVTLTDNPINNSKKFTTPQRTEKVVGLASVSETTKKNVVNFLRDSGGDDY